MFVIKSINSLIGSDVDKNKMFRFINLLKTFLKKMYTSMYVQKPYG